jgi:hypothetical protein
MRPPAPRAAWNAARKAYTQAEVYMKLVCRIWITAAALVLAAMPAVAQSEKKLNPQKVPQPVRQAFEQRFPQARLLGAAEEKDKGATLYEIESEWRGRRYDVTFKPDGTLVAVEETIPMEEAPAAVLSALKKEFPTAKVVRAEKITEAGAVTYEFQLNGAPKKEAKFSPEGKLLAVE